MNCVLAVFLCSLAVCLGPAQAYPRINRDYFVFFRHYQVRRTAELKGYLEQLVPRDPKFFELANKCPTTYSDIPDNVNFGYITSDAGSLVQSWGSQRSNYNTSTKTCAEGANCREYMNIIKEGLKSFTCLTNDCTSGQLLMCSYA